MVVWCSILLLVILIVILILDTILPEKEAWDAEPVVGKILIGCKVYAVGVVPR